MVLLLSLTVAAAEPLQFVVPHAHDAGEARARIGYLLDYWQQRFGVTAAWREGTAQITGSIYGVGVNGVIEVGAQRVAATVDDPGWLFRERVSAYIGRMLRKYMHPRYEAPISP